MKLGSGVQRRFDSVIPKKKFIAPVKNVPGREWAEWTEEDKCHSLYEGHNDQTYASSLRRERRDCIVGGSRIRDLGTERET